MSSMSSMSSRDYIKFRKNNIAVGALCNAVKENDEELVLKLLDDGYYEIINMTDRRGHDAMYYAVFNYFYMNSASGSNRALSIIEILLDSGTRPSLKYVDFIAADTRVNNVVNYMIAYGVDVNEKVPDSRMGIDAPDGSTPFHIACSFSTGYPKVIETLLMTGQIDFEEVVYEYNKIIEYLPRLVKDLKHHPRTAESASERIYKLIPIYRVLRNYLKAEVTDSVDFVGEFGPDISKKIVDFLGM